MCPLRYLLLAAMRPVPVAVLAMAILTYRYLPQRASGRAMEQVAGPEGRNKERKKSKKASRREKKNSQAEEEQARVAQRRVHGHCIDENRRVWSPYRVPRIVGQHPNTRRQSSACLIL